MSLATVQKILARLYTNRELRDKFFGNPQHFCRAMGLNEEEIKHFARLSRQQIDCFVSSLKQKRLNEVRKLLPLTQKSLGRDFSSLFWQYAETNCPQGIQKHWRDAIAFCVFLDRTPIKPDWVLDVVRYEQVQLQRLDAKRKFLYSRFRYEIGPLVESLTRSPDTPTLVLKSTLVVWWRALPKAQWRKFRVLFPNF